MNKKHTNENIPVNFDRDIFLGIIHSKRRLRLIRSRISNQVHPNPKNPGHHPHQKSSIRIFQNVEGFS